MKKRGNIFIHFQSFVFYQFKRIDVSKSGGSDAKESACNVGDLGSIPELGRSPGEGNSYPFQCSGLENSLDKEAWHVTVHGVAKSQTCPSNFHLQIHYVSPFSVTCGH